MSPVHASRDRQRLDTLRTYLRPFRLEDAPVAFGWFSDPEVMRFIPSPSDESPGKTADRIARYLEHGEKHGFSKWIIIEKATGMPVGDAGFFTLPGGQRPELGYRLSRSAWGRGLATEVAARWLDVAADWYGFPEVFAFAHPENSASLHVMQKLGFQYSHTEEIYGMHAPLHRLELASRTVIPHVSPTDQDNLMTLQALHIPDGAGASFNLLGLPTTVKITSAQSGGAYVLYEQTVPRDMGVPPHVHTREDEIFFVLKGEVEFLAGDSTVVATAGSVVYAPRHVPHSYKGVGESPARIRFMIIPGEMESMFAQLASWPADEPPDLGKLAELCGKFGISFL